MKNKLLISFGMMIILLGVLMKTSYSSYRIGIIMKKAIIRWGNIPELLNISTFSHIISIYQRENAEYNKY